MARYVREHYEYDERIILQNLQREREAMNEDLKQDLDERLTAISNQTAALRLQVMKPAGDWKELIRRAETLAEDAGAIRDMVIAKSPGHQELVKKYGEDFGRPQR